MPDAGFHIFSTAGNTTLFVDSAGSQGRALASVPCEQAGFADPAQGIVEMAGGEFCVNACLAFAALQALNGINPEKMRMAGESVEIAAKGEPPLWTASAVLSADGSRQEQPECGIVHLPGISHVLLNMPEFPAPGTAFDQGRALLKQLGLEQEPAAGIIWWRKSGADYEIMPLVHVPAAGTFNLEGACGSGSMALSLFLGPGLRTIRQPSGESLLLENRGGRHVQVTAQVRLVARGELWLS